MPGTVLLTPASVLIRRILALRYCRVIPGLNGGSTESCEVHQLSHPSPPALPDVLESLFNTTFDVRGFLQSSANNPRSVTSPLRVSQRHSRDNVISTLYSSYFVFLFAYCHGSHGQLVFEFHGRRQDQRAGDRTRAAAAQASQQLAASSIARGSSVQTPTQHEQEEDPAVAAARSRPIPATPTSKTGPARMVENDGSQPSMPGTFVRTPSRSSGIANGPSSKIIAQNNGRPVIKGANRSHAEHQQEPKEAKTV